MKELLLICLVVMVVSCITERRRAIICSQCAVVYVDVPCGDTSIIDHSKIHIVPFNEVPLKKAKKKKHSEANTHR